MTNLSDEIKDFIKRSFGSQVQLRNILAPDLTTKKNSFSTTLSRFANSKQKLPSNYLKILELKPEYAEACSQIIILNQKIDNLLIQSDPKRNILDDFSSNYDKDGKDEEVSLQRLHRLLRITKSDETQEFHLGVFIIIFLYVKKSKKEVLGKLYEQLNRQKFLEKYKPTITKDRDIYTNINDIRNIGKLFIGIDFYDESIRNEIHQFSYSWRIYQKIKRKIRFIEVSINESKTYIDLSRT